MTPEPTGRPRSWVCTGATDMTHPVTAQLRHGAGLTQTGATPDEFSVHPAAAYDNQPSRQALAEFDFEADLLYRVPALSRKGYWLALSAPRIRREPEGVGFL